MQRKACFYTLSKASINFHLKKNKKQTYFRLYRVKVKDLFIISDTNTASPVRCLNTR